MIGPWTQQSLALAGSSSSRITKKKKKYQGQLSGSVSEVPLSPNYLLIHGNFQLFGKDMERVQLSKLNFCPLSARLLHTLRRQWKYFMSRYKQRLTLTAGLEEGEETTFWHPRLNLAPLLASIYVCISESFAVSLILSVSPEGRLESSKSEMSSFDETFPSLAVKEPFLCHC